MAYALVNVPVPVFVPVPVVKVKVKVKNRRFYLIYRTYQYRSCGHTRIFLQ